jgi:hypothetical protein
VRFTAELWRERRHWFDQHVTVRAEAYRIRWDPRERVYTLVHPGPGRRVDAYERLDDLLEDLSAHEIAVHPRWALDDRRFLALGGRAPADARVHRTRGLNQRPHRRRDHGRRRGEGENGSVPPDISGFAT